MKISQFATIRVHSWLVFGGIVLALSLTIDVQAQNVGIGFSSPQSKLTVNGNLAVGADYNLVAPTNGAILEGNVGIGTSSPVFKEAVIGQIAVQSGAGQTYPTTGNYFAIGWNTIQQGDGITEFVNYQGTGGGNPFEFFRVPNTGAPTTASIIASISATGAYSPASDKRLKTDVQPLHYGLHEVMALQPKEYDFHLAKSIKNGVVELEKEKFHQVGFLAQDVYQIVPEAVDKPKDDANEFYRLNYSALVPVVVNAVQEMKHLQDKTVAQQQAKITEQETKIASLEAEVTSLKEANQKLAAIASKLEVLEKAVTTIQQNRRDVQTVSLSQ